MSTEIVTPDPQQTYSNRTVQSEQGLLLAVLVMVVLGVLGVFLVS
ncbi:MULTISPECIES: hypothetical protein [unclassified Solwaraspora]|mgnify:CR=1 FL=1|nr:MULTISPECIES: hypothetical protein [unclassified Solwaraspora]WBB99076.1 hypothetical protein O7553_09385 [Solwaraspora sp. WMMA2059]WBC22371.1 hypothetical protein O7543_07980 [Solwaraspora sp. WMMA2080]WJK35579.1 hypothetical protein O7610_04145 [Solwaraspora sp. WMMA2065]